MIRLNSSSFGAGIVGSSAAYYLTEKDWRDIVVLDQGPLFETGGSSSHAPGLVFQLNAGERMCQLARRSVELYSRFELDGQPGFYTARKPARIDKAPAD